ncbi:hypothetical protein G8770_21150 [Aestuariicella hydrocarbonica]|uniref:Uncharacterized protein n=1 Tax=Pseudomaricurvus hydrocarbonicus TaxID=1470433 RepID=A0A9E5MPQ3_9GAMM|nr:hypothetical protein [Aestuariicella hydrocarbonica]NHO68063.1 hypothetical protein [Aestuariicella hydrocarbonica]
MKKLLIFFAAGCFGGLVYSLVTWQFGQWGIPASLGVSMAPSLSLAGLYPRIVLGGLWGLLFILPMLQSQLLLKGAILSLFPSIVQLFFIYPLQTRYGIAGLELGLLTPVFVLFFNWVWGVATALMIKFAK